MLLCCECDQLRRRARQFLGHRRSRPRSVAKPTRKGTSNDTPHREWAQTPVLVGFATCVEATASGSQEARAARPARVDPGAAPRRPAFPGAGPHSLRLELLHADVELRSRAGRSFSSRRADRPAASGLCSARASGTSRCSWPSPRPPLPESRSRALHRPRCRLRAPGRSPSQTT